MLHRVLILGNAACGKTTLSKQLAVGLSVPCYHIDDIQWWPGWNKATSSKYSQAHDLWLAEDNWVIEGMGPKPEIARRMTRATAIIFIDLPLEVHMALANKRENRGDTKCAIYHQLDT